MNDKENRAYMAGKLAGLNNDSLHDHEGLWKKHWNLFLLGYSDGKKEVEEVRGKKCIQKKGSTRKAV